MSQRLSVVKKEDIQQHSKGSLFLPLQRSLKNLVDRSTSATNSDKQQNTPKSRKTIHNSLEILEKEHLLPKHAAQTQSNIELQNVGKNSTKRVDVRVEQCGQDQFLEAENLLDSQVGKHPDKRNVDALMLPSVITKRPGVDDNFLACSGTIKPSKSLPEALNIITDNRGEVAAHDVASKTKNQKHLDTKSPGELILLYLLNKKADVNACDVYGSTPLHYAAMRNKVIAARHLLNTKGILIGVGKDT